MSDDPIIPERPAYPFQSFIEVDEADLESVDHKSTVGFLSTVEGSFVRGDITLSLPLLTRAVLIAQERYQETVAEVGIIQSSNGGSPLLAMVPKGGGAEATVVAPRQCADGGFETDPEEMVVGEEEIVDE